MEKNNIRLTVVNGVPTLEQTAVEFSLSYEECYQYASWFTKWIDPDESARVYNNISKELWDKSKDAGTSRRVVVSFVPDIDKSDFCTSTLQLLQNREPNQLIVFQRSMSTDFFLSDLGFFVSLALMYKANLKVIIGSFHFVL